MKISIIIATFNAESTLKECLNNIVPQLNIDCELIIIDGKSTDQTLNIINQYKEYITYTISEKDNGVYDAWNKGIKRAKGEWIMFIGADDVLLPNAIKTYLQIIQETPYIDSYDYICAQNEFIGCDGKILKLMGEAPYWHKMRRYMAPAHVASLHNKKNLFDTIGLYDYNYKICADYELLLRKRDNLKFLFINSHIARMKTGGISFTTKAIIETYHIRKKHKSVPTQINILLFCRDWIGFELFKIKNFHHL